jgi:hypothetical protein
MSEAQRKKEQEEKENEKDDTSASKSSTSSPNKTKPEQSVASSMLSDPTEARMRLGAVPKPDREGKKTLLEARSLGEEQKKDTKDAREGEKDGKEAAEEEKKPRSKKIPVIFIDEVSSKSELAG